MKNEKIEVFKKLPIIKTERLLLRKLEIDDLSDVYEYASDPLVPEFLLWNPHESRGYTKAYLRFISKLYRKGKMYDWGISINGKIIGTAGFSSINFKNNSAEIGYVLNRNYWGLGIAGEAVMAVLNFGFSTLNFNRIEAIIFPDNKRSKRVLEKCGLKSEGIRRSAIFAKGEYRDVEAFSVLKEEFFSNK